MLIVYLNVTSFQCNRLTPPAHFCYSGHAHWDMTAVAPKNLTSDRYSETVELSFFIYPFVYSFFPHGVEKIWGQKMKWCGTDWPAGWLVGSDPTMEDGEVHKTFCLSNRNSGCKYYEKYKIKDIKRKKTRKRKEKNRKYWYSGQTDHHFARPLIR